MLDSYLRRSISVPPTIVEDLVEPDVEVAVVEGDWGGGEGVEVVVKVVGDGGDVVSWLGGELVVVVRCWKWLIWSCWVC